MLVHDFLPLLPLLLPAQWKIIKSIWRHTVSCTGAILLLQLRVADILVSSFCGSPFVLVRVLRRLELDVWPGTWTRFVLAISRVVSLTPHSFLGPVNWGLITHMPNIDNEQRCRNLTQIHVRKPQRRKGGGERVVFPLSYLCVCQSKSRLKSTSKRVRKKEATYKVMSVKMSHRYPRKKHSNCIEK